MPESASAAKATKARKPGARGGALVLPTGNSHGTVMAEQTERPESWESVRIGELLREVEVRQADLPKTEANTLNVLSLTKNDGLILQSVRFGKRIATDDTSKYKVVREGQIVYNPYVIWEGAVHALRKHRAGLVSPVYPVWETVEPDGGFVDYLLRTPPLIDAYNRVCSGAVNRRRSIREEAFTAIEVTVPPLRERQAVAAVLRTVQWAKEATEKVIAATRQLKASLMKHLFTYGPVPYDHADRVALKETDIGPMPAHWRIEPLGELWRSELGKMLSPKARAGKSPRPYLRNANVQWGRIDLKELFDMDFAEGDYSRYGLLSGDVLVCEGGEVGRTAIWRGELQACYYQKALHRLRPRGSEMTPEFFMHHMMHAFMIRRSYGEVGTVTTIAHLPGVKLKALPLPVPSRNEQDEIIAQLAAVDAKLAAEERRRAALDALFKSLLHHLMTGKVRLPEFAGAVA